MFTVYSAARLLAVRYVIVKTYLKKYCSVFLRFLYNTSTVRAGCASLSTANKADNNTSRYSIIVTWST